MRKKITLSVVLGVALGVCTLLLAAALGLGLIHITDFPYSLDIDRLSIAEKTGLTRQVILANYNAVMDFLSPFSGAEFALPDLAWSESGAFHFEECKVIFNGLYLLGAAAAVLMAVFFLFLRRRVRLSLVLSVSGCTTVALPLVVCAAVAVDFSKAFVLFPKIFFNNDMWIFEPVTDPVINILPSTFFMHCAVFLCAVIAMGAAAELIAGRFLARKEGAE